MEARSAILGNSDGVIALPEPLIVLTRASTPDWLTVAVSPVPTCVMAA